MELVELEDMAADDEVVVKGLLQKHLALTGSGVAEQILANWREYHRQIVKVIPGEYKKAMQMKAEEQAETVA